MPKYILQSVFLIGASPNYPKLNDQIVTMNVTVLKLNIGNIFDKFCLSDGGPEELYLRVFLILLEHTMA